MDTVTVIIYVPIVPMVLSLNQFVNRKILYWKQAGVGPPNASQRPKAKAKTKR